MLLQRRAGTAFAKHIGMTENWGRRAEDQGMPELPAWVSCLQERALALADLPDRERRHIEVIEAAQAQTGLPLTTLELAYEIALEEGLDPALALEVLVCKIAV